MSLVFQDLGELVNFKGGGTPSRNVEEYWNSSIPWATVKDLNEGITLTETQEFISELGLKNSASNLITKGTIIIPTRMALGKVVISEIDVAINQDLKAVFVKDKEKLDVKYLLRFLESNKENIASMGKGATVKGITLDQLKAIKIPLPPLVEQRRIASILDQADELRQKRQQAIEKLDQLLQSTFYDYFGDPIQNTKSFPLKNFKSIIKFTGGSQPPKSVFSDTCKEGYIRLVQIRDFRTDKYLTFIPKDSARRFFKRNDVMIGRYGPPVFQILRGLEGAYNVALMKAEPKAELDNDFLFYLLAVESIQQLVIANSQRSAGQTGVNLEFLNNLVIGVPPLEIQKVWAKIALKIEEQKQNLYNQLDMQNQLFSSLQNQAFNGTL